jgi:hypothetical protein
MSYTRKYHEMITVRGQKTVTVSYPASQNGGSKSVTVDYREEVPVDINIHVDTKPFDNSVENCNDHVNMLTTAVVAAETAQIISIDKNAKKVATTVVNGFFSYIKSEISQQIAELSQNIDAQLMHLRELAHSCSQKKIQMEADFSRISGRYVKIFDDLNNELKNRVFELDKPTFQFKKELDQQKARSSENDMVNIVTIIGKEGGTSQNLIGTSFVKKRALDSIQQARVFLWQQKNLNNTIQKSMINESTSCIQYSPICYMETKNEGSVSEKKLFTAECFNITKNANIHQDLISQFSIQVSNWNSVDRDHQERIKNYFSREVELRVVNNDTHSARVKSLIFKMANINQIKTNIHQIN